MLYRKRKLPYPTGMLSLALLPLLCIAYMYTHHVFDDPRMMEITWWNKDWYTYRLQKPPFDIHPEREFVEINLTGNKAEDEAKLAFAQLAIRELVSTNDTTTGVHFKFEDHAKYSGFVRALNILTIEKASTYAPYKNHIWVFNYPALKEEKFLQPKSFCSTVLHCFPVIIESSADFNAASTTYTLSIAILAMLTFTAFRQLNE